MLDFALLLLICVDRDERGLTDCGTFPLPAAGNHSLSLSWQHSVEKSDWQELYGLDAKGFLLKQVNIQGSGAGMDIPAEAVLINNYYTYYPKRRFDHLRIRYSPYTSDYHLCIEIADHQRCQSLWAWLQSMHQLNGLLMPDQSYVVTLNIVKAVKDL